jgi:hypothetical protein
MIREDWHVGEIRILSTIHPPEPSLLQVAKARDSNIEELKKTGQRFEQHAGTILRCSLTHVEAVQTIDMPELCEHMGQVLSRLNAMIEVQSSDLHLHSLSPSISPPCEAGTSSGYTGLQEVLVVYYLGCIGARMEDIPEDRKHPPVACCAAPRTLSLLPSLRLRNCSAPSSAYRTMLLFCYITMLLFCYITMLLF